VLQYLSHNQVVTHVHVHHKPARQNLLLIGRAGQIIYLHDNKKLLKVENRSGRHDEDGSPRLARRDGRTAIDENLADDVGRAEFLSGRLLRGHGFNVVQGFRGHELAVGDAVQQLTFAKLTLPTLDVYIIGMKVGTSTTQLTVLPWLC